MTSLPCSRVLQVNRLSPQLVTPAKPTPHETKLLSDIDDQEGLRFQTPVLMSYKNNPLIPKDRTDPVKVLKEALSKALVFYYPLAGRLREGPNRKLMVECTGEGVLFIEADADVTLEQLGDAIVPPCPFLEEFLCNAPGSDGILGCPLLLVQVTRLKCGGFIFALRINHTMCDGSGLVQFLNAVGEMAHGAHAPSIPPVWQRELFDARNPLRITCTHHEYEEAIDSDEGLFAVRDQRNMVQKSFYFGAEELKAIRKHLPAHLSTSSTFDLITACLWKCRTLAIDMNQKEVVCISCISSERNARLPLGYYGNAFALPSEVSTVESLCKNPIGYALELVKKAKAKMSDEYIKSVADLMVMRGRPDFSSTRNFVVGDTTRAGFGEVDFGWGKPVFAGPAKCVNMINMYVRHKTKEENGILVLTCLPLSAVERFQQELKRMTVEPVEDNTKPVRIKSTL
ncbi:unnamed protein product [Malus baccata var. baccata]